MNPLDFFPNIGDEVVLLLNLTGVALFALPVITRLDLSRACSGPVLIVYESIRWFLTKNEFHTQVSRLRSCHGAEFIYLSLLLQIYQFFCLYSDFPALDNASMFECV